MCRGRLSKRTHTHTHLIFVLHNLVCRTRDRCIFVPSKLLSFYEWQTRTNLACLPRGKCTACSKVDVGTINIVTRCHPPHSHHFYTNMVIYKLQRARGWVFQLHTNIRFKHWQHNDASQTYDLYNKAQHPSASAHAFAENAARGIE